MHVSHLLTSVATHTPRSTRRGEQNNGITQEVDVRLQVCALLVGELGIRRIELDPVSLLNANHSASTESHSLLILLEVDGEVVLCARHCG